MHLFSAVKAHIRKGHALLAMKDTIRASQAFEKALELDPNSVVSHTHTHTHTHTHIICVAQTADNFFMAHTNL